jgi:Starch synthase catalytic domain
VLIVTMEVIGPSKGGGIATAYTALSEALAEAGHPVTVLYTERYHLGEWSDWEDTYSAKGVEIIRLWDSVFPDVAVGIGCATRACVRSYRVYMWLRARTGMDVGGNLYDIVHFHDNGGIGYFSELAKYQGEDGFNSLVFIAGAHGPHFWERYAVVSTSMPSYCLFVCLLVWFGLVWFGLVWFGLVWFGLFCLFARIWWVNELNIGWPTNSYWTIIGI